LARSVSAPVVSQIFGFLFRAGALVRQAPEPKLAMEMIFIELSAFSPASPVDALIEEIHGLRRDMIRLPSTGTASTTINESRRESSDAAPPISDEPRPASPTDDSFDDARRLWQAVAQALAEDNPALAALFTEVSAHWNPDGRLEVSVGGNPFQQERARKPKSVAALEAMAARLAGRPVTVVVVADPKQAAAPAAEKKRTGEARQTVLNHPLVKDAIEIFGGDIVDVKSLEEDGP